MAKFGDNLKKYRAKRNITQAELATLLEVSSSTIGMYEQGRREPDFETLEAIADFLNVNISDLLGDDNFPKSFSYNFDPFSIPGILPIETKKIPLLGEISCGKPSYAEEDFEGYVEAGANLKADFALRAKGDSMIGARILDGDIVFVRMQSTVDPGEIAVVIIDGETTLKRFKVQGKLAILSPENPAYDPIVVDLDKNTDIRILGKAIAFQSGVR